jgi:hypothetical protein
MKLSAVVLSVALPYGPRFAPQTAGWFNGALVEEED